MSSVRNDLIGSMSTLSICAATMCMLAFADGIGAAHAAQHAAAVHGNAHDDVNFGLQGKLQ